MTERLLTADRTIGHVARVVSAVFTPLLIPLLVFVILFLFSYLRIMPLEYKLIVLGVVCSFTLLLPLFSIYAFRRLNRLTQQDLHDRQHRYAPFVLTIVSYVLCLLMMRRMNIPWYMSGIVLTVLIVTVVCAVANLRWRVSEHTAGAGSVVGGVVAFSALFGYDPVGWLCLTILVAGVIGSARLVLGRHTLGEVLWGFVVGFVCALGVLHPLANVLARILLL